MPPTAAIPPVSRRTVLGAAGAAGATAVASVVAPELASAAPPSTAPAVSITVDGNPLTIGSYTFPSQVDHIVLDNGLVRITFGRDDAVACLLYTSDAADE